MIPVGCQEELRSRVAKKQTRGAHARPEFFSVQCSVPCSPCPEPRSQNVIVTLRRLLPVEQRDLAVAADIGRDDIRGR